MVRKPETLIGKLAFDIVGLYSALTLALASCGDEESKSRDVCREYIEMCRGHDDALVHNAQEHIDLCVDACTLVDGSFGENERYSERWGCAFMACGVDMGYCDNQGGDDIIMACVERHGWESN